jgi:hypothetical protein
MVSALGQPLAGDETGYFIKFDAWHIREWKLIRQAFPDVPWIFLYRDPIEVLVSQVKMPGSWTLPGQVDAQAVGLEPADLARIPRDEYCVRVLASLLREAIAALEVPGSGGRLIHYRELPSAVWTDLARHFGIQVDAPVIERLREVAGVDAKAPGLPFVKDSETKRRSASARLVQLSEEWLVPLYERLEAKRLTGRGACE